MSLNPNEWRPTRKQATFLALPTWIKEATLGGGAGSGKTDVLLLYAIIRKWHLNPRFKQVFLRRTSPELKREVMPRSRDIYRKFGATFNQTDMLWTFPREDQYGTGTSTKLGGRNEGAMIFLGHCENEDDVHIYDSMEINLFTPEELTTLTEYIYLYIGFERTRAPLGSGLPAIIRSAAVSGGIGHSWVRQRFVKPYEELGHPLNPDDNIIIEGRGGNKRFYIHATAIDNEYLDPDYVKSLQALPEAEKRAKLYGDWDAYLGQVFEEFRDRKYPDEPEEAIHVIEPFDIPSWWPRIFVIDWGYSALTYVGFAAISPYRRVYIYRELYWRKTKIEEWGAYVKPYIQKEQPKLIRVCKSAGQNRGEDHTIQQQIETALECPVELTANSPGSRLATKALLHEYLRWKSKYVPVKDEIARVYNEEHAFWILRNKGIIEYKAYLNSFNPMEVERLPKLQIFGPGHGNPGCPVLTDAIKAASYDKKKTTGKAAEDVAEYDGDDPYDVVRYIVDAADRFMEDAKEEMAKAQKQEELLASLEKTQDYTSFYMNMRRIEAKPTSNSIDRYHGRRRH